MDDALPALDAAGLLTASTAAVRRRRLAEVADLLVLAQWAAVHSGDPTLGPDGALARRAGNVLVQVGGEGTPRVQDFCLGEIALARGTGVTATRNALADTLDLMHRLPRTWAVCEAGEAEIWVARKVAKLSRHLPFECVGVVDAATARVIAGESGGRVIAVAEAKIIEAAPGRFQHPDATADEVRAVAFGYLARPAELLAHTDDDGDASARRVGSEGADVPLNRTLAFPAELLEALQGADFSAWAPQCRLYVHLHEAVLHGADGVARVEGLGAMTLSQLQQLLGRADLVVKPVIDLSDRVRTTAYEHPGSLKERIHLTTAGDYWPYATTTSRAVDYDHPIPYLDPDHGGPPGQTGTHNSGPLGRRHHRWKTHAGYRSRQSGHGRYAWTTPHGLGFLVDHRGTRPIDPDDAKLIIEAPPDVDIYPGDVLVELNLQPQ